MLFENIRFALRAILRAPLRTALTLIGITFGVAAVVIVQGVGEGFQRGFEENMAQLGSNLLIVWSGRESQSVLQSGKRVEPLTLEDAEALMLAPHVKAVAPACRCVASPPPTPMCVPTRWNSAVSSLRWTSWGSAGWR